jgi:flagellar biosynthesis/type III secretory pathway protein FliH
MIRSSALSLSLLAAALAAVPASASAQWQWRDANGRMVYSDVPPPPSVARIVKSPGQPSGEYRPVESAPANPEGAPARPAAAKTATAPTPTAEEAFQKRRTERLDAAAKEAQKEAEANERATRCAQLRNYAQGLQQGARTGVVTADGGVQYLGGEQRQAEIQKTNAYIEKDCG